MNLLQLVLLVCIQLVRCSRWLSLEEWLVHPETILLGSSSLAYFVPPPITEPVISAYDRFSITELISRVLHKSYEPSGPFRRHRTLSDEVLAKATDNYRLGLVYLWSLGGVPRDLNRAMHYFELSAAEGNECAMFMLGVIHSTGLFFSTEPSQAKAIMYYSLANSLPEAQMALGHRYKYGINVPINHPLSLVYYRDLGRDLLTALKEDANKTARFPTLRHLTSSFGGLHNTGLYGKYVYHRRVPPYKSTILPMGDRNSVLTFIRNLYDDEFDSLSDAYDTLSYRAIEEEDPKAMLAMAMYFKLTTDISGATPWNVSISYARKCIEHASNQNSLKLDLGSHAAYVACGEFLAERYLLGDGRPQNLTRARTLYQWSYNRSRIIQEYDVCSSCLAGLSLCDWMENEAKGLKIPTKQAIERLEKAFFASVSKTDASLGILLADMQISLQNYTGAHITLIKTVTDTEYMEPVSLLMLGELEYHHIETKSIESIRDRYAFALRAAQEMLTPIGFAQVAYEQGDIESAIIAYAICSELGIREADINLADLIDVRHSMLGIQLESWWPRLKALSTWSLPSFVTVERRTLAVRYFSRAALHHSVDALAKLVEYGWYYGLVPAAYIEHYLNILISHNFGLAHWWKGMLLYNEKRYNEAMNSLGRAMINPEAWLPVKFSQFLTTLQLLRGDEYMLNDSTHPRRKISGWSKALEAYRSIVANDQTGVTDEGSHNGGHRIWAVLYIAVALILAVFSVLFTLARRHG